MREASETVALGGRPARPGVALASSAILHLAIAWLLLRAVPERPSARVPAPRSANPLEISIIDEPGPLPDRRPPLAPPPDDARRNPARHRTGPRVAPQPPEVTVPEAPGPPVDTGATRPAGAPAPQVDLSFASLADTAKRRLAVQSSASDHLERLLAPEADRPRTVDQLRAAADRRLAAIENVRAGRADPLHFDYLRGARDRLTPEATRIAERLPLGPAESVKGWVRGYLGRVGEVNRGTARDLPVRPSDDPFGPRPDVLGQYREAERQAASGAVERTAQVCLGVAPNHPVRVTVGRSSGNAALDRLAVESFRASADARPVAAEVRPGLACYLVRIRAYRVPPTPSISLTWNNGPKVLYPLKRVTEVSVELESVDYGDSARSR